LARLKGFTKLVPIDDALETFFGLLKPKRLPAERLSLHEALGRVAAKDLTAQKDVPPFNRSAVDGYAVRAKDTVNASVFNPKTLRLTRSVEVGTGEAKPIWTGNQLPKGADAVAMLEHTKRVDGEIEVFKAVTPGENVSRKGEDVRRGEVAVRSGTRLKPQHLGLLASLGYTHVPVVKKPRVAVLATGDELVELGKPLGDGQVTESNRLIISGLCTELGAEPISLGISRDDVEEIREKIREGLEKADVVVTTGGTSVGHKDLVPQAINGMGSPGMVVHGVAMQPGMPTGLAVLGGKPVFVLSGNPVAAMIGFEVFVRPLILEMLGVKDELRPRLKARLTRRVSGSLGKRVFLRVLVSEVEGEFLAEPVRVRGSGIITTMTKANGYVVIPESREGLEEGEVVTVHLFDVVQKVG